MCNACGFLCCGSDMFSGCGCDHCKNQACHDPTCRGCGQEQDFCICDDDSINDDYYCLTICSTHGCLIVDSDFETRTFHYPYYQQNRTPESPTCGDRGFRVSGATKHASPRAGRRTPSVSRRPP